MDNSAIFSEEDKSKIYSVLVDAMLLGLDAELATTEDAQESSEFILENLEKVTNQSELTSFLEAVSSRWPVYHDVLLKIKAEQNEGKDQQRIEQARQQINNISS